jgi:hypothetical protein
MGLPSTNANVFELDSVGERPDEVACLNGVLDCALAVKAEKRTAKTDKETSRRRGTSRWEDMSGPQRGTRLSSDRKSRGNPVA